MKKAAVAMAIGLGGFIVYSLTCSWFLDFFRIV
jgi:hypothetical protein